MPPRKVDLPPDVIDVIPDLLELLERLEEDPRLLSTLQEDPGFHEAIGRCWDDKERLVKHVERTIERLEGALDNARRLNQLVAQGRDRIRALVTTRQEADLTEKMTPYFSGDGEKSPLGALEFAKAHNVPIILPGRLQPDWHSYNPGKRIGEVFRHGHFEYAVTTVDGGISLFFKAASGWLQMHTYNDEVAEFFGESTDRNLGAKRA